MSLSRPRLQSICGFALPFSPSSITYPVTLDTGRSARVDLVLPLIMRPVFCFLSSALLASMTWAQSPPDVAIFKITPVKCTIRFGVKASLPIVGIFDKWDSTLTFNSNHAEDAVLDVKIQAKSVDTGSGMENEKLNSKDFFDVKHSPYITFHSNKVVQTGPNTFDAQGTFAVRGVSKPETLHLTLSGKGTGHGELTGTMAFDRKDYGMNGGIPFIKIADRVEVTVDLKGDQIGGPPVVFKQ
jgi:polyisoprenoid-binding protein YceI